MSKQINIDELIILAQKGDQEAFGFVYDELINQIYRYIYFKTPSVEIAEDLTEEVFFKAWKNLKSYKKQKYPFSAWIFRIAHNEIADFYRKNKVVLALDETWQDEKEESRPQKLVESKLVQKEVQIALKQLPDNQAQAIILKYINALSIFEIAKTMQKSETAVRVLLSRGLGKLKTLLAGKDLEKFA